MRTWPPFFIDTPPVLRGCSKVVAGSLRLGPPFPFDDWMMLCHTAFSLPLLLSQPMFPFRPCSGLFFQSRSILFPYVTHIGLEPALRRRILRTLPLRSSRIASGSPSQFQRQLFRCALGTAQFFPNTTPHFAIQPGASTPTVHPQLLPQPTPHLLSNLSSFRPGFTLLFLCLGLLF